MLRKLLVTSCLAAAVTIATPAKASADWLFTPFVGMNFGGTANFNQGGADFEDEFERRGTYGASLAWMGGGIFGFEVDFGYAPNFFEVTEGEGNFDYGDSNVTTLMANVTVGAPIGGQTGTGIRPYASGGIGLIRSRIDDVDDLFGDPSNNLGMNVGGGLAGFFNDRFGLRGDVRYFRSLQDEEPDEDDFDIGLGTFSFWRGSVGLIIRF